MKNLIKNMLIQYGKLFSLEHTQSKKKIKIEI